MLTAARKTLWLRLAFLGALFFAAPEKVLAQIPNLPIVPGQVQRAIQAQQAGQQNVQSLTPNIEIYQPITPEQRPEAPPSRLETIYTERAGRPLTQFGYDILGVPTPVSSSQVGAVQDSYILGQGDEVVVVLRGQEDQTYREQVNRDGQIILPKLNPIQAAGRSLGDVRNDLEQQVAQTYISTNAFVSLGNIREISVLVTGEVRAPGTRILSALATPLDALLISGGIAKTGSLRNVSLIRGNQTNTIDLYALLTQGNLGALGALRNGDRIYVPPLQNTIAVTGLVRRPGIYELRAGEAALDADALIRLAGGYEIAGAYRLSKMRLETDGTTRLVSILQRDNVANGEILFVDSSIDSSLERVRLSGAARLRGVYPRATASSVARLINGVKDITPEAYTPFAAIVRRDPRLNTRVLIPFSLTRVLAGSADVPLQNDDLVYIFTRDEIRALSDAAATVTAPAGPTQTITPLIAGAFEGALVPDMQPNFGGRPPENANVSGTGAGNTPYSPASMTNAPVNPGMNLANSPFNPPPAATNGGGGVLPGAGDQNAVGMGTQATQSQPGAIVPPFPPQPYLSPGQEAEPADILRMSGVTQENRKAVRATAKALNVTTDILVRTAGDHLVWVLDQVRDPGAYLAAGDTTLDEIVAIAGGPLDRADLSFVEVTSTNLDNLTGSSRTNRTGYKGTPEDFRKVSLRPLDVIRLRPVFSDRDQGQVRVSGEVRFPGNFDIIRGERLSSLLERAGGLTDQAYPYGAVFRRRSTAEVEYLGNLREAREIEAQIATLAISSSPGATDQSGRATLLTSLAQQLRAAPVLGRITITADPALLRVRPELDILLEPGDRLVVPKRPSTVTVAGEVLNSGTFQYQAGLSVDAYIDRAGGTTDGADKERIFVVLPDGTARTTAEHWLSFNNSTILPPGSTIVVPRDLRPFDLTTFLKDATQITSQIAITAASIAVLNR